MKRVVVGLSGGVDSSVSAYLLKQEGYDVIGIFMKNWHDSEVTISSECPWLQDSIDARLVAEKLNIPFQVIDLSKEYKEKVADYMISEYKNGRTPNPDVLCNSEIKFKTFLEYALSLDADYLATGHYCQKVTTNDGKHRLLAGKDVSKDQSYFLCQLTQYQLSRALFPLGKLTKKNVREIANQQGFITANKKDSQGLCFIGKVKITDFLSHYINPKEGDVIEVPRESYPQFSLISFDCRDTKILMKACCRRIYYPSDGKVIGKHRGVYGYTIGQRKGLNIGGKKEPLFVIGMSVESNIVYVGEGIDHPGLYHQVFFVPNNEVHWLSDEIPEFSEFLVDCRLRYRQALQQSKIIPDSDGLYILFKNPQQAASPGQFIAWYVRDELIGSAVIQ